MTLILAVPLTLSNLGISAIHATDLMLLGRIGSNSLAAGALGLSLYTLFLVFGTGLITAASPMIAHHRGARRNEEEAIRKVVHQAMLSAAAVSSVSWAAMWQGNSLFLFLGQDPATSAEAALFVRSIQWALLPMLCFTILRSFVSAIRAPFWSVLIALAGACLNGVLGHVLTGGPLGTAGAGIATAVASLFMFLSMAVVVSAHPELRRYGLFSSFCRLGREDFRHAWKLGLPIAVTLTFEIGIFNSAAVLIGLFGSTSIAAHAIAMQVVTLAFMVPLGLAQAATVRVSVAHGAEDWRRMVRSGWTSLGLSAGFMLATALLLAAYPELVVSFFLEPVEANREVASLAVSLLAVAALFQIFDGLQAVGAGVLRGIGDTTIPMIYAGIGYVVVGLGAGIALAFGFGWNAIGMWYGLACGLATVALLMVWRWARATIR